MAFHSWFLSQYSPFSFPLHKEGKSYSVLKFRDRSEAKFQAMHYEATYRNDGLSYWASMPRQGQRRPIRPASGLSAPVANNLTSGPSKCRVAALRSRSAESPAACAQRAIRAR